MWSIFFCKEEFGYLCGEEKVCGCAVRDMASSALLSPRAVSARSPFATEKLSFRGSLQSWTQGLLRPKVPQISHRVLGWREVLMAVPSLTETPPVTGSQVCGIGCDVMWCR